MPLPSSTHLVIIPSYNPGPTVLETIRAAREQWTPVWVVVDGSTDGSAEALQAVARNDGGLRVIVLPENRGKGAAVLEGISQARTTGFTHALTMDSDGQHPAELIPDFMAASQREPQRMILGKHWPLFRRPALPLRCRIRLGRRFDPPGDITAFTAELERYFRIELGQPPVTVARSDHQIRQAQ